MIQGRLQLPAIGLMLAILTAPLARAELQIEVSQTPLIDVDKLGSVKAMAVSPDFMHIAMLVVRDDGQHIIFDGQEGPPRDWIIPASLAFSADGTLVGYIVQRSQQQPGQLKADDVMIAVIGDKEGKPYRQIAGSRLLPIPSSPRFAYIGIEKQDGPAVIVVDGQEGKPYARIGAVFASKDGHRIAYAAEQDGKQSFIIDGIAQAAFDKIGAASFAWSADGKRHVYGGVRGGKMHMVIDGKETPPYDEATNPAFSPDGRHVAYAVTTTGQTRVILDGREQKPYDTITNNSLRFSPDSSKLAYMAGRKERIGEKDVLKTFFVVNGEELKGYDGVLWDSMVFSPDSKRLAYAAINDQRIVMVLDGKLGKEYDAVHRPQFTADSARLTYVGRRGNSFRVITDETESDAFDGVAGPILSATGARVMYAARQGQSAFTVVDNKQGKSFTSIPPETLAFSPDGRHYAYVGHREKSAVLVIDGHEVDAGDGVLRNTGIAFDSPGRLHMLIGKAGKIVRMQGTIAADTTAP